MFLNAIAVFAPFSIIRGFLKLSIFRGGFEREAAQKIAGASLRTLTNLVNKSLLTRDPNGRYFIQKTLLQYAAERFANSAEKEPTRLAHCMYYAEFTSKFAAPLNSPKEQAAVEALDLEHENILVAWQHGLDGGEYQNLDVMQETLHYYYLAHSWLREGYDLFKELADKMEKAGYVDATYWRARIRQTWSGTRFGKYDEALQYATQAIEFFGEDSHSTETAHALNQLSYVYMVRGDYEKAKEYARKSVVNIEPADDFVAYYMGMGNLGYAHYLSGELQQAREIYERLNMPETFETYSPSGVAYGKNNLGEIVRDMGEIKRAADLFQQAYEIFEQINNKRGMAFSILNLGGAHFVYGEYIKAKENYIRAYELYREIGDQHGLAHALSNLGNAAQFTGEYELAKGKYEESLRIRRSFGDKRGIADSLSDLAGIYVNLKQFEKAYQHISESLAIRVEIGDKQGEGSALAYRAMGELMLGYLDDAQKDFERARAIGDEVGDLWTRAQSYAGLGELACIREQFDEGLRYFKQVLTFASGDDLPLPVIIFSLTGIAGIYVKQKKYEAALELLTLVLRYPSHFMSMSEDRATALLEEITTKLDEASVQSTMQQSKSLVMRNVIADLLAEN
jgi:tetratricopeptide (TPR) repeat protein